MRRVLGWIEGPLRLLWGASSAALALLVIVAAPTYTLWLVTVLVVEWGYLLALVSLAPLLPGWRRTRVGQIGGALGLGAALVALTPLLRAIPVAQTLPGQLAAAFGPPPPRFGRPAPLVAADLLRGVALPAITPRTIAFGEADGQPLDLDLYPAQGVTAPAPLVVIIHGGAWQGGDKTEIPTLGRYIASRGYAVATVNYRLSPRWRFPAARDDVRAALVYLKANAATLGIDPARIVLVGRSAGGQLALLVAYTAADPAIRGVVSLYGPTDLADLYAHPSNPRVLDSTEMLTSYLGGPPDSLPDTYAEASPISFVGPDTPPTLLIHGRRDDLIAFRQSQLLANRLESAGRPHLLLDLPWATHVPDFYLSGPGGQISTYGIEYFLGAVMR